MILAFIQKCRLLDYVILLNATILGMSYSGGVNIVFMYLYCHGNGNCISRQKHSFNPCRLSKCTILFGASRK